MIRKALVVLLAALLLATVGLAQGRARTEGVVFVTGQGSITTPSSQSIRCPCTGDSRRSRTA
jgi:hypothetical protein